MLRTVTSDYNAAQKRKGRQKEDYLKEIENSGNKEKPFYENIVQIGKKIDTLVVDENEMLEEAKATIEVLDCYANTYQERNPNGEKIAVHTGQIEKLKKFIASRGLEEAFAEFVKSLAPKTMKQKLEEAKVDATEYNQQRKNSQQEIGRRNKKWQKKV